VQFTAYVLCLTVDNFLGNTF